MPKSNQGQLQQQQQKQIKPPNMSENQKEAKQKSKQPPQKPRLSQQQVEKYFPPRKVSPMKQPPPGPNGQIRLNYFQKALTVRQLQPWETKVPPEEYDNESVEKDDPKPYEEHQIGQTQKRITDYINKNSKKPIDQVGKKSENQPLKQPPQQSKPQQLPPSRQKKSDNEYKVVVKESPQRIRGKEEIFYKNNDIYGVEDKIFHSSLHQNQSDNHELDEPVLPSNRDVEIDGPLIGNSEIPQKIQGEKPIQCRGSSQTSKETPVNRQHGDQNSDKGNLPASSKFQVLKTEFHESQKVNKKNRGKDVQIDVKSSVQRKYNKGVQFYYNKQGTVIFTQQAYKEPLSPQNIKAYVIPVQMPQKLEVQDGYQRHNDKNQPDLSGIPQALKDSSSKKLIIYRKEQDLQRILHYMGMEQQKIPESAFIKDKSDKHQKNCSQVKIKSKLDQKPKDVQIDRNNQKEQFQLKPIKMNTISDLNSLSVGEEQIQMSNNTSFVDRPHPVNNLDQRQGKKSVIPIQKRTTKKKQFFRSNTGSRFNTPSRYNEQQKSRSKKEYIPEGSVYHFELIPNKISQKKSIVQVRRSSRIYVKSKSKHQRQQEQKLRKIEQTENEQLTNTMTMGLGQHKTQTQASNKSKKKASTMSKVGTKSIKKITQHQSEEEQITIDWLKEHIGELNQIVIHHAYMEQEYYAMTEKDQAISRFLQQLEDKKQKIQIQQTKNNQQQPVRQNHIIHPKSKKQQNKAKSSKKTKQSKQKSKRKINQSKSKSKANIKIQRTVQIQIKHNQNIPQNQIDYSAPWKGPFLQQQQAITDSNQPIINVDGQPPIQNNNPQSENRLLTEQEKKQIFKENKEKYKIPEVLPLTVRQVVDPDILGLGVYALIRFGRLSEFQFGTQYAITPLCMIRYARMKHVRLALEESKKLVPPEYADNIALIALNSMLIELIEKARKEKQKKENKETQSHDEKDQDI